jgi:hypothetical protein
VAHEIAVLNAKHKQQGQRKDGQADDKEEGS